ncbi:family 1 glycosylhydrolase [Streptomyces caniscabiei]|uniref:glycoside hydrolase family 1 protein n=1 Tax=Streptomyces caniscabiei TaxID=2746961 RepID=UPI0029A7956A|nr:family 1 glycosylhydrolase [Streptomyces caniscabiei]MDX2776174.1 family 1 glycosylhydrolase [Streptomyces caniscabiei]
MHKKPRLTFPKKFLWGAATSAHQIEGNTHNQWTVWELEHAKTKAAQAVHQWEDLNTWEQIKKEATDPQTYVSGGGADHYRRYEEDFDLLEKLNMNAFRFSIEWARVEPTEGAWSVEAIEHYKQYVAELKRRGIEPVVTLFHFTLPTWFTALGGFEKRANVRYFLRFTDKMIRELGPHVRLVITINEPEVYAHESYLVGNWPPNVTNKKTALKVLGNLAYAHNQAARLIHGMNRRYKVSVAKNSMYFYAGDDAVLSRKSADIMQYVQDDYFLKKVVKSCDFLGVNYYFSNRVYGYRTHNPNERVSDLGWDLSPAHIQFVLERLYEKYGLPIVITENGLADSTDEHRQWWLTQTLAGMQKAMDNGVRIDGYLHWSLLDNFEWDKGFWPRFGLAHVDYRTKKRTLRPSALWFGKVIQHLRGL